MVGKRQALIRLSKDRKSILVLCNLGHLLEVHTLDKNFAGSMAEADLAFGDMQARGNRLAEQCQGYGH